MEERKEIFTNFADETLARPYPGNKPMNYPFYIARRLSLSSGGRKKAPAVGVAVAAVALSVAVMLCAIAIVLGFKQEIRDKIVGFNGHISLYVSAVTQDEDNIMTLIPSLKDELSKLPFITDYSLQAAIPAILKTDTDFKGIYLRGLSGKMNDMFIRKNLEEGKMVDFSLPENKTKIAISRTAANQLNLKLGDKINTYFISDEVRVRKLEIVGIFNSHFDEYDDIVVFGALPLVQQLGGIEANQGTYLQISTDSFDKIPEYTYLLQSHLNDAVTDGRLFRLYHTDNVLNQGASIFGWLSLLDTNVVVVLVLMMVVGCVTLISGMLIIIIEKKRFIGIIRALGAPIGRVRDVFVWLALRVSLWGMLIGNAVGFGFMILQKKTHLIPLDADSYYIDFVPIEISWQGVMLLNVGVLIVTYLVLILPSRFVAEISPSETMRNE